MTDYRESLESVVGQIAPTVADGNCVLFLGSGVHSGPPEGRDADYPAEQRPLSATRLSHHLAASADFAEVVGEEPSALSRTSMLYELKFGRVRLLDEVEQAVQKEKTPSPLLRHLARLPFRVVITTNYDTLFEQALEEAGKRPTVIHYSKHPQVNDRAGDDVSIEQPYVVKLHGDIVDAAARDSVVITDEDYIQFLLRMNDPDLMNPVPLGVKHYLTLRNWKTLFVGYSLRDYNLRLLFRSLRRGIDTSRLPQAFSVDSFPDPLILETWQREQYVWIVQNDIWAFVPLLADAAGEAALQ